MNNIPLNLFTNDFDQMAVSPNNAFKKITIAMDHIQRFPGVFFIYKLIYK